MHQEVLWPSIQTKSEWPFLPGNHQTHLQAPNKHVRGSCCLHSPLPAAPTRMLVWPASFQRLIVTSNTFISAHISISQIKCLCGPYVSNDFKIYWRQPRAGGSVTPGLRVSSVEDLELHDAESRGQHTWNQSVHSRLPVALL